MTPEAAMREVLERYKLVRVSDGWSVQTVRDGGYADEYFHGTRAECQAWIDREAFAAGQAKLWQDISTAPRDGTHFLAYEPTGDMYRAAYHSDGYLMSFCGQPVVQPPEPTHWMQPLPTPPAVEGEG